MNIFEEYAEQLTPVQQQIRKDVGAYIKEFSDIIKKTKLSDVRTPVIAGGAVRDMFFGLPPEDYDIFIDVSSFDDETKDDKVLLTALRIRDALGLDPDSAPIYEKGFMYEKSETAFMVYECTTPNLVFQVIGHNNSLLSTNPLLFVEQSFDWPLTKALVDPEAGLVVFSDEFVNTVKSGIIKCKDESAIQRAQTWLDWRFGHGKGLKIEYPKNYKHKLNKLQDFAKRYRLPLPEPDMQQL